MCPRFWAYISGIETYNYVVLVLFFFGDVYIVMKYFVSYFNLRRVGFIQVVRGRAFTHDSLLINAGWHVPKPAVKLEAPQACSHIFSLF